VGISGKSTVINGLQKHGFSHPIPRKRQMKNTDLKHRAQ
jgi:hypothetical protein